MTLAESLEAGVAPAVLARSPALSLLPPAEARRLARGLETGASLATTLGSLSALSPSSVAILRAAEAAGGLPAGLRVVAARMTRARRDAGRVLLLLAYPALLLLAAALILPLPALFRTGLGGWARQSLPLAGAVLAAVLGGVLLVRSTSPGARAVRSAIARSLPFVRAAVRYGALADFVEVLGACLGAGLPARAALPLAAAAGEHPALAAAGSALVARLDAGASLVETLGAIPAFPADLLGQVHAAEHAGTLDAALARVGATCRERARSATIVAMVSLTAVVLLVVGGAVGYGIVRGFADALQETDQAIDEVMRQR